jgi:hypothetical protein
MHRSILHLTAALLAIALLGGGRSVAQSTLPSSASIGQQMEAFWQGQAHFQEVREIDWNKPPYNAHHEGAGWFANPMPFPHGSWYLFSRRAIDRPSYCPQPEPGLQVIVRESSDQGNTWSNPAVVVATPGPPGTPDACGIVDGSTYYDSATSTWQMLAQCLAEHNKGGWALCHYVRRGPSPMGMFTADPTPAVTGGQLWSQICSHSGGICDPRNTHDEGTPDIVFKRNGYFYVTFHGFNPATKQGLRGVAKTADFHNWLTSGTDLPNAPIFASPECQAWNPGCIGGGEASTLVAGDYQYMMIETPSLSLGCTPGQNWPIALLRAPNSAFPESGSLWQPFPRNPLLQTAWPSPQSKCGVQYPRWALGVNNTIYILYEDSDYQHSHGQVRRLLRLVPTAGPPVALMPPPATLSPPHQ